MRCLLRYLSLLWLFIHNSLLANLEYRVNFAAALFMSLLNALWAVGGALLFYTHRTTIGGWTFHETLIVIGLFFIASGFVNAVMQPNVRDVIEAVRSGTMDYTLIRPINPMFHATLRRFRFEKLSGLLVGMVLIGYALTQLRLWPALERWLVFGLLGLAAVALLYALMAALAALCLLSVFSSRCLALMATSALAQSTVSATLGDFLRSRVRRRSTISTHCWAICGARLGTRICTIFSSDSKVG